MRVYEQVKKKEREGGREELFRRGKEWGLRVYEQVKKKEREGGREEKEREGGREELLLLLSL